MTDITDLDKIDLTETSNVSNDEYIDRTEVTEITKATMNKILIKQLFLQSSFNYERMQSCGWLWSILPGLEEIHKNKEDLSRSMRMHNEFFNTHPQLVTFIMGVVLAMEKSKQSISTIRSFKIATMGPLGGIGDATIHLTIIPICAAIAATLALNSVVVAPLIFLLAYNIIRLGIQLPLLNYGYRVGINAVSKLKEHTQAFSRGATILGITVVGALTASFVHLSTTLDIKLAESSINIQTDVLDKIMPNILPLLSVIAAYKLIMKGFSPTKIMLIIIVGSVLGRYLGIV